MSSDGVLKPSPNYCVGKTSGSQFYQPIDMLKKTKAQSLLTKSGDKINCTKYKSAFK